MSQLNLRTVLAGDNIGGMIDKINYNFQQIMLGGGGPKGDEGLIGPPGSPGPVGPTGGFGPTGPTGTYVFVGTTAPNSLPSLLPTPRVLDVYIQPDSGAGQIVFWEKSATGATGWSIVDALAVSEGVFTTAIDPAGGGTATTAAFAKLSAAQNLFVGDLAATETPGLIFQDVPNREFESFLSQSTGAWLAGFANPGNQLRFINSDPTQIGTLNPIDKTGKYAGAIFSLESTIVGNAEMLLTLKDARLTGTTAANKLFSIKLNDTTGDTTAFYADTENNAAVGAVEGDQLNDKFTVFGSALVYDPATSRLQIDADPGGTSRLTVSIGERDGTVERFWYMDTTSGEDHLAIGASLPGSGSSSWLTGNVLLVGATSGDSRVFSTSLLSVGDVSPVADFEVGSTSEGRVGIGQIEPDGQNLDATSYIGFNAFRYRGDATNANWLFRGGGGNSGAVMWSSPRNSLLGINVRPTTSTGNSLLTSDDWVLDGSILFTRGIAGSTGGSTKLFINSAAYAALTGQDINSAPDIVIGATVGATPFSTGKGVGLYGVNSALEFLGRTASGGYASGFRMMNTERSGTGLTNSILKIQSRASHASGSWQDAISIYRSDLGASSSDGNVVIGAVGQGGLWSGATFTPNSVLTVKGAASGMSTQLISQNLLDIQLGATPSSNNDSVFRLNAAGDVTAGLKFGNATYDSTNRYTLDHYDEGTWVPRVYLRSGANYISSSGLTASVKKANYTRIGNQVTVDFAMHVYGMSQSGIPSGTGADIYLKGFPFRPDFENVYQPTYELRYPVVNINGMSKNVTHVPSSLPMQRGADVYGGFVLENNVKTKMYLYKQEGLTSSALVNMTPSDMGVTASSSGESYTYLNGRFSYFISADSSVPLYTGATSGTFVLGATGTTYSATWDYDTNPISSYSLTGSSLPAWFGWVSGTSTFYIVAGATVTSGTSPVTVNLLATDTIGNTGAGQFIFSITAGTVPTLVPLGYTGASGPVSGSSQGYFAVGTHSGQAVPNYLVLTGSSSTPMTGLTATAYNITTGSGLSTGFTFTSSLNATPPYSFGQLDVKGSAPLGTWDVTATATNGIGATWQKYRVEIDDNAPLGAPLTASFTWDNTGGTGFPSGRSTIFVYSDSLGLNLIDYWDFGIPGNLSTSTATKEIGTPFGLTQGVTYYAAWNLQLDEQTPSGGQNMITTTAGPNASYTFHSGGTPEYTWDPVGPYISPTNGMEWEAYTGTNQPIPFVYTSGGASIGAYVKTTSVL